MTLEQLASTAQASYEPAVLIVSHSGVIHSLFHALMSPAFGFVPDGADAASNCPNTSIMLVQVTSVSAAVVNPGSECLGWQGQVLKWGGVSHLEDVDAVEEAGDDIV